MLVESKASCPPQSQSFVSHITAESFMVSFQALDCPPAYRSEIYSSKESMIPPIFVYTLCRPVSNNIPGLAPGILIARCDLPENTRCTSSAFVIRIMPASETGSWRYKVNVNKKRVSLPQSHLCSRHAIGIRLFDTKPNTTMQYR